MWSPNEGWKSSPRRLPTITVAIAVGPRCHQRCHHPPVCCHRRCRHCRPIAITVAITVPVLGHNRCHHHRPIAIRVAMTGALPSPVPWSPARCHHHCHHRQNAATSRGFTVVFDDALQCRLPLLHARQPTCPVELPQRHRSGHDCPQSVPVARIVSPGDLYILRVCAYDVKNLRVHTSWRAAGCRYMWMHKAWAPPRHNSNTHIGIGLYRLIVQELSTSEYICLPLSSATPCVCLPCRHGCQLRWPHGHATYQPSPTRRGKATTYQREPSSTDATAAVCPCVAARVQCCTSLNTGSAAIDRKSPCGGTLANTETVISPPPCCYPCPVAAMRCHMD